MIQRYVNRPCARTKNMWADSNWSSASIKVAWWPERENWSLLIKRYRKGKFHYRNRRNLTITMAYSLLKVFAYKRKGFGGDKFQRIILSTHCPSLSPYMQVWQYNATNFIDFLIVCISKSTFAVFLFYRLLKGPKITILLYTTILHFSHNSTHPLCLMTIDYAYKGYFNICQKYLGICMYEKGLLVISQDHNYSRVIWSNIGEIPI